MEHGCWPKDDSLAVTRINQMTDQCKYEGETEERDCFLAFRKCFDGAEAFDQQGEVLLSWRRSKFNGQMREGLLLLGQCQDRKQLHQGKKMMLGSIPESDLVAHECLHEARRTTVKTHRLAVKFGLQPIIARFVRSFRMWIQRLPNWVSYSKLFQTKFLAHRA
jgi:hypothetical protein